MASWFWPSLKNRNIGFESMDNFYNAMESIVDWEKEDTEINSQEGIWSTNNLTISNLNCY
jgi:hypothetical protein